MPSRTEPCGLAQMIALRYGTIPVVHAVGGLNDTVTAFDAEEGTGNGVRFDGFTSEELLAAIKESLAIWGDEKQRTAIIANGMNGDYSWDVSAGEYLRIYETV